MVANVNFEKTFVGGIPTLDSAGDQIIYQFSVTHLGGDNITKLTLSDSILGLSNYDLLANVTAGNLTLTGDDGDGVFESGETWTFTQAPMKTVFTYVTTQADFDSNGTNEPDPVVFGDLPGQIDNEARLVTYNASMVQQSASLETASAPLTITPDIHIVKSTNGEDANSPTGPVIPVGDPVTWTYVVTNPGNVAISNVVVTDDNGTPGDTSDDFNPTFTGGDTDMDGKLDVGETWTYTKTGGIAAAGQYTNIADVAGNFGDTPVSDDDPSNYFGADVQIAIVKETNGTDDECQDLLVGKSVTWTYTVTNPGGVALSNVVVTDDNGTPGDTSDDFNPTFSGGDTNMDGKLDTDETWTYTAMGTVQAGEFENIAYANGSFFVDESTSIPATEASEDDCYNGITPGIAIVKTTNGTDDQCPEILVGDPVTWGYTVTNTGDIELSNVVVVDDNGTPGDTSDDFNPTFVGGDTDADGNLDLGETWTYSANGVAALGEYTNIASVSGDATDIQNNTTSVNDSEDDCYTGIPPEEPCTGVRTPGFWQNPNNGGQFWDGIANNEKNGGKPGFASGELLYAVDSNNNGAIGAGDIAGLLLGDYNHNGLTDAGEDTLFISYTNARLLINSSNKQVGGDGRFALGRDMVATWLNYLAVNGIGDDSDTHSPQHYLNDGIDWMQRYSGATAGGLNETFDAFTFSTAAVKTSSALYNTPQSGIDHSASQMHSALDYYNNHGQTQPGGFEYSCTAEEMIAAANLSSTQTFSSSSQTLSVLGGGGSAFSKFGHIDFMHIV